MKILFLGQEKCMYGPSAVAKLRRLGHEVLYVKSKNRHQEIPIEVLEWSGDYLLSFRTHFIIKNNVFKNVSKYSINFHPGPLDHPGSGSINFALLENNTKYGVTAHLMTEQVDNGSILKTITFDISHEYTLDVLLNETHFYCYTLINLFIDGITNEGEKFILKYLTDSKNLKWLNKPRRIKELDEIQKIDCNISIEKLNHIIRATYNPDFPPYILLHGYKFNLTIK